MERRERRRTVEQMRVKPLRGLKSSSREPRKTTKKLPKHPQIKIKRKKKKTTRRSRMRRT